MANPANFKEATDTFVSDLKNLGRYPVWLRDYQLGKSKTIQSISVWVFDPAEIEQVNEIGVVFLRVLDFQPPVLIYNASIVDFEGRNAVFKHKDCLDLPAYDETVEVNGIERRRITSAWALDPTGRKELNETGCVTLAIVGGQTEVEVFGINPIN